MQNKNDNRALDRREFMKVSLAAAAAGGSLQQIANAAETPASGRLIERNMRPSMKVARMIRPQQPDIFDAFYDEKLMVRTSSPCQKAYDYVLNHGLDVANSHMPNFKILEENLEVVRALG